MQRPALDAALVEEEEKRRELLDVALQSMEFVVTASRG